MIEIVAVGLTALFASVLTFFSGFGLGTILMPVFAVFFPIEVAIALTGIVHLLNNLFKIALVGRNAAWRVVLKFGVPAIIGAVIGAFLLMSISETSTLYTYQLGQKICEITVIKLIISLMIIGFVVLEFLPFYKNLKFSENKLYLGGLISGFFGGLSGHQGALRSAFLIKCGLSKESFIATGVIIASIIDISRISIYFTKFNELNLYENRYTLIVAILSAFTGAYFGKKILKKITIETVHITVSVLLIVVAILLGAGFM